jgi:hypothetical protein
MNNNPYMNIDIMNDTRRIYDDLKSRPVIGAHPLEGYDLTKLSISQLESIIETAQRAYDHKTLDTPLVGPTRRHLNNNPALREAWEQFEIIRKLQGVEKK